MSTLTNESAMAFNGCGNNYHVHPSTNGQRVNLLEALHAASKNNPKIIERRSMGITRMAQLLLAAQHANNGDSCTNISCKSKLA